jgi:4'-phosphopantetheinyl transferase
LADAERIAERFFSQGECEGLRNLPDAKKLPAFFNLWTRKEAWLKATGDGISDCLGQVEVSFLPDEPARLIRLPGATQDVHNWTLHDLVPASGFVGALAAPANDIRLHCWHWPG